MLGWREGVWGTGVEEQQRPGGLEILCWPQQWRGLEPRPDGIGHLAPMKEKQRRGGGGGIERFAGLSNALNMSCEGRWWDLEPAGAAVLVSELQRQVLRCWLRRPSWERFCTLQTS